MVRNKKLKQSKADINPEIKALKEKYDELIRNEINSAKTKKDRKYIRNKFTSFKYTSKFLNISLDDFKEVYKDEFNVNQITLLDMEIRRERLKSSNLSSSKDISTEQIINKEIGRSLTNSSDKLKFTINNKSYKTKLEGEDLLKTYRKILSTGATEIKACSECGWDYKTELGWFKQAVRKAIENENLINNKPESNSHNLKKRDSENLLEKNINLRENRKILTSIITRKTRSPEFRKKVLNTHGMKCACCQITNLQLIEAAHIIPVELDGSDNPLNGLPLCANHHLAFDSFLFAINPNSLEIEISQTIKAEDIGITNKKVLINPDRKCLEFRMNLFKESQCDQKD